MFNCGERSAEKRESPEWMTLPFPLCSEGSAQDVLPKLAFGFSETLTLVLTRGGKLLCLQSTEGIDRMHVDPSVSAPGGLMFHQN